MMQKKHYNKIWSAYKTLENAEFEQTQKSHNAFIYRHCGMFLY